MTYSNRLFALSLSCLAIASVATAQDMAVSTVGAQGSTAGTVTLSAAPLHAMGPAAISLVAFELAGAEGNWTLPPANDGGKSGDAVAGDGVWSLAADLPGIAPGRYALTVYVVDSGGAEFISAPFDVTLN